MSNQAGLTTHILDVATGNPARGVKVSLFHADDMETPLAEAVTNEDGRTDKPLLRGEKMQAGQYELRFHIGAYFAQASVETFFDVIPIRFKIADASAHYHVPLLVSPFGYSTYRGS